MQTDIYIIAGFLGSGKTTLIQKLLCEAFHRQKVVVVENDFGEVNIDALLLQSGSFEVTALNDGCICCSLSGHFIHALADVLKQVKPDVILIEPSGVARLSEIVAACSDSRISALAQIRARITVVDALRCRIYLDNFDDFYADQIQQADIVVMSRTDQSPEKVAEACSLVAGLRQNKRVISEPWSQLKAQQILGAEPSLTCQQQHTSTCCCACTDADAESGSLSPCAAHQHEGTHFDSVTIRPCRSFSYVELSEIFRQIETEADGIVLRAKGIIRSGDGYHCLQYVPGDMQINPFRPAEPVICIIGHRLDRLRLIRLFEGAM